MKVIRQSIILFAALTVQLLLCGSASAHFVFVYGEDGKVKVVFGEDTDPDQTQFLAYLKGMKAFTFVDGQKKELTFNKVVDGDIGWMEVDSAEVGSVVSLSCPFGVYGGGEKSMFLDYSAKFVDYTEGKIYSTPSKDLSLDLIPSFENGRLKVSVYFKGIPLKDAEISLTRVEAATAETVSDEMGNAVLEPYTRYLIRAKHVEPEAGEYQGKKYAQKSYYCNMVVQLNGEPVQDAEHDHAEESHADQQSSVILTPADRGYEDFPRGMTSFGAAVLNNRIYVTGGKSGRAHRYARSYQNGEIFSLDLEEGSWSTAGETLGLQGLALVAHDGKIIRIGGLEARNEEGEEHQLRSLSAVKAFDPETQKWSTLPSLPRGRSSFDACLVDNKIFVAGGWAMEIGEDSEWAEDMLVLDLSSEDPSWKSIEAPFMKRALAVEAHAGKVFAIGGIQAEGGTCNTVHVYDVGNGSWNSGPDLPCNQGLKGFGCSAVSVDGNLFVSTYDGGIYCLSGDQKGWDKVHQMEEGRFFHQMLPAGESSFAIVGGSHMSHGSQLEVAVFDVSGSEAVKVSAASSGSSH